MISKFLKGEHTEHDWQVFSDYCEKIGMDNTAEAIKEDLQLNRFLKINEEFSLNIKAIQTVYIEQLRSSFRIIIQTENGHNYLYREFFITTNQLIPRQEAIDCKNKLLEKLEIIEIE